ncbi:hypothetical protein [Amycolatopsis sp. NPDC003861]
MASFVLTEVGAAVVARVSAYLDEHENLPDTGDVIGGVFRPAADPVRLRVSDLRALLDQAGTERYPHAVGIFCDRCSDEYHGDYLVSAADDQATRFCYAREHLNRRGWRCGPKRDLCPRCYAIELAKAVHGVADVEFGRRILDAVRELTGVPLEDVAW